MKKDAIIEVYIEDNVVIVKDLQGNSIQITASDTLTIRNCLNYLKN